MNSDRIERHELKNRSWKTPIRGACAALAVSGLVGCSTVSTMEPVTPYDIMTTAAGAAIGGYFGSFFGGSMPTEAWIASGVIVGGYGGYKLGRMVADGDIRAHNNSLLTALDQGQDGVMHHWNNAENGHTGFVRTTGAYRGTSGEVCRRYRAGAAVDKEVLTGEGIACQAPNGQWRVLHDDLT